jgi:CheY-like chemotaxis protein
MMAIEKPVFLYVEDDHRSRMVLQVFIERVMNYQTLTMFEDSQDFEAKVQALDPKPNVIFLDIQISPLSGYQMLEILRKLTAYEKTFVIAMTANVMSHDVEALKKAGFTGLIGKPLVKEVFTQLVERILAGESVWYVP